MNPTRDEFGAYPLRRRSVWHLRDGFWDVLLALPLFFVYLATLQEGVGWWDSGELVAAVKLLTVAHRPGFPLYVVAGHALAGWAGDPRFLTNLISAAAGALAMLFIWRAFRLQAGGGARSAIWILAGGWLCGLSPLFWRQAVRAEVYTPAYLVLALALLLTVSSQRAPDPRYALRRFLGAAYCVGLAFCVHTALAAAIVPALVYLFLRGDFRPSLRHWGLASLLFGLGLSVYLYVPLRASHAAYVWGEPTTAGGLWQYFTASDSFGVVAANASGTFQRMWALAGVLYHNASGLLMTVGAAGLVLGAFSRRAKDRAPLLLALSGGLVAATVVSTVIPDNLDLQAYLFPLLLAAWWGWNQLDPAQWSLHFELKAAQVRWSTVVGVMLLAVAAGWAFRTGHASADALRRGTADRWGHALLTGAKDGDLLVLQDANTDFLIRGLAASDPDLPSVVVLNTAFSPAGWYRRWWENRYLPRGNHDFGTGDEWVPNVAAWWRAHRGGIWVDYGIPAFADSLLCVDGWMARWDTTPSPQAAIPRFSVKGAEADPDWIRTAVWYYYRLGHHYLACGMAGPAARAWDEGLRWAPEEETLLHLRGQLAAGVHAGLGTGPEGDDHSP